MRKSLYSPLFIFLLTAIMPAMVWGAEVHGLISVEDYFSKDSSSAYDFNILTTRTRLDATKLNTAGTLGFHFDGRERNVLASKDYNSSYIKSERIDTLNIEYTGLSKGVYLSVGRQLPKELSLERVDGLNLVYSNDTTGGGVFGGLKPDPYTDQFGSDYSTAGAYLFHRTNDLYANLALVHNGYKGETDRQYISGSSYYYPSKEINLYGSIMGDINQDSGNTDLTNALLEASYRPGNGSISVGYTEFQSIRYYKSMPIDYTYARSSQHSYYLRGDYRLGDRYTLYGRFDRQTQISSGLVSEEKIRDVYHIGFRNDNLLNSNISVDISDETAGGYGYSYNNYRLDMRRLFGETFELGLNGSLQQSKYDYYDGTETIMTYGASGDMRLAKRWHVSLSYEGMQASAYSTNTAISRVTYRF